MSSKRPSNDLYALLTYENIASLASERTYNHGAQFFERGRVVHLAQHEGTIDATVIDVDPYRVTLRAASGTIHSSCTCPTGTSGKLCMHAVAVALEWIRRSEAGDKAGGDPVFSAITSFVDTLPRETLIALLLKGGIENVGMRGLLVLEAAKKGAMEVAPQHYRDAIDFATALYNVDRLDDLFLTGRLERLVSWLDDLVRSKLIPIASVELVEYAIMAVQNLGLKLSAFDDTIDDIIEEMEVVHHDACAAAGIEPIALAERLFELDRNAPWDDYIDVTFYGDLLGPEGEARYRQLKGQRKRSSNKGGGAPRPTIRKITNISSERGWHPQDANGMQDAMSALINQVFGGFPLGMGPDTPYLDDYNDQALAWAEEKLQEADEFDAEWLTSYLIEGYFERGMHERMMEVAWNRFLTSIGQDSLDRLREAAGSIGQWPLWLKRVDTFMRELAAGTLGAKADPKMIGSLLASIYLEEDDDEQAWQAAMEFGAIQPIWLDIAEARIERNPADAIAIYRAEVDSELESSYNYDGAVTMLKMMERVMATVGQAPGFKEYLDELRATWSRRKKFITMLDNEFVGDQ